MGDQGEGLYVFKFKVKVNNVLYDGVEFSTSVDYRDATKNLWDFSYKEGTNEGQFMKPMMAAPYRLDKTELDLRILAQPLDDFIVEGRDAARTEYEKKSRAKQDLERRKFDVWLPDGYKLSQRPFGANVGKEGVFTSASSTSYNYQKGMGTGRAPDINTVHSFITWRFVNMTTERELTLVGTSVADAAALGIAGL